MWVVYCFGLITCWLFGYCCLWLERLLCLLIGLAFTCCALSYSVGDLYNVVSCAWITVGLF